MPIEAGDAIWRIIGDLAPLKESLAGASDLVKSTMDGFLGHATQIGAAFISISATIRDSLGGAVEAAMDYGGAIQDAATRTGIGAEEFQKLKFGAEQSGSSMEGLEGAIIKMNRSIAEARSQSREYAAKELAAQEKATESLAKKTTALEKQYVTQYRALTKLQNSNKASSAEIQAQEKVVNALANELKALQSGMYEAANASTEMSSSMGAQALAFAELGLNVEGFQDLKTEEQFFAIAEAISKITDPALKTAIVMDLFGKSGAQLIPFLNEGAAGMEALGLKAQELGLVMSGDSVAQAEAFGDQWEALKTQFQMVAVQVGTALIPALMEMMPAIQATIASVIAWVQANPGLVASIGTVIGVVGGVMAVLGPLLVMLPGIVAAFAMIGPVVAAVGAVLAGLAAPVAIAVGVIGIVVAVGYTMYNEWENIVKLMNELWTGFKSILESVWNGIVSFLETAAGLALAPFLNFIDLAQMGWEGLMATIDIVVGAFESAWDAIVGGFEWVGNQLEGLWNWITGLVESGVQGVVDAVNYLSNLFGLGDVFGGGDAAGPEGKALGGPVTAGVPYIVGERGEELFVPDRDGRIIPNNQTRQMLGGNAGGIGSITINIDGAQDPRATAEAVSRELYRQQVAFGMA